MQIHIILPEQPTDDQIKKAIEMIGHYAGQAQMQRVAAGFMNTTSVPTPPAVAPVPTPPGADGKSGLEMLSADSFTGANGITIQLDKAGLPWDVRIHSSSKNTNKDGTWKAKKNVTPLETNTVTAELRNALANRTYLPGGMSAAAPAIPDTNMPLIPPAVHVQTPPAVPTPPAAAGAMTFPTLMQKVAPLLAQKKLTQENLQQCAVAMGLPAFSALGTHPELIDGADAYLSMLVVA